MEIDSGMKKSELEKSNMIVSCNYKYILVSKALGNGLDGWSLVETLRFFMAICRASLWYNQPPIQQETLESILAGI
jgi:hypothetical protein